jgi:hypothetical protein
MVNKFKEHLQIEFEVMKRNRDDSVSLLNIDFSNNIMSDDLKFYLSRIFNANLIFIDNFATNLFYYEPDFQQRKAYLVFYESDDGVFYMLSDTLTNDVIFNSTHSFVSTLVNNIDVSKNIVLFNLLKRSKRRNLKTMSQKK